MTKDPTLSGSSKVTSRGQITVPQELREKHGIQPGDTVYFLEEEDRILLRKGPIRL